MDTVTIRTFFMWCAIINMALLLVSSLFCAAAGNWVYRVHSRFFPLSREAFNTAIYSLLGLYKMLFIAFSLVPYIALVIIG
jgi:hypothetical protein